MADEYLDYLDPDYSSEAGNKVDIYIKEGIGTVFTEAFAEAELTLEVGILVGGLELLSDETYIRVLYSTWTIDSFLLTVSLPD